MITNSKLVDSFYPVEVLRDRLVRCADELPKTTFHTYFKTCEETDAFAFVVSQDLIADEFAELVLNACGCRSTTVLEKADLARNPYGFTHVLFVPHRYHSELKGRLDAERASGTLCVPIFNSEFSGSESAEEFMELRRNIVPTSRWDREVSPKISFRFDNARTGSGTGDGYVFARFDQVLAEIGNLSGVRNGFVEILNYRDEVVEILPGEGTTLSWISARDDTNAEVVSAALVRDRLWTFLTA